MGFKADTSFLRFLSMGAAGAGKRWRRCVPRVSSPIDSNATALEQDLGHQGQKLPAARPLMRARTGLRVEVRAKSDLKIRMSDAPNNPDRRWDNWPT